MQNSIAKPAFNNVFVGFFSKVITYLNYALIAYFFGAKTSTDVYYFGFSFTTTCAAIFLVAVTNSFSPFILKLKINHSIKSARYFSGSIFLYLFILSFIVSAFLALSYFPIYKEISKFSSFDIEKNKAVLIILSLTLFLTVILEFFRIYIQAMGFFIFPAVSTLIQSIIYILIIFLTHTSLQLFSVALALFVSLCCQVILYLTYSKWHEILPIFNFKINSNHKFLLKSSLPIIVTHFIVLFVAYYMDYIASGLGSGILTSITLANRLYLLPMLVIFNPILEIINNTFSYYYYKQKHLLALKFVQLQRLFMIILIPISIFIFFFKEDIVYVFFKRGEFGLEQTLISANCLALYALTITTYCLLTIIAKIYFILEKTFFTSIVNSAYHILMLLVTIFLLNHFGYRAIPLGKLLVEILFMVPISYWLINKYLPFNYGKFIIIPLIGLTIIAFAIGYTVTNFFEIDKIIISHYQLNDRVIISLRLIVSGFLFFLLFYITLYLFKFNELIFIIKRIKYFINERR